jgi:MFS family permease
LLAQWSPDTPDGVLLASLCFHAFSTGLFMSTAMVTTLWQVPMGRMAQASTLRQIILLGGAAVSSAVLAAVLGSQLAGAVTADDIQSAYNSLFLILTGLSVVAFMLTLRIPDGVLRHPGSSGKPSHAVTQVESHDARG